MAIRKGNKLLRVLNYSFYDVPCPPNLSYLWSLGSSLGFFFLVQVVSGFLLSCHYIPSAGGAFDSIEAVRRDVSYGWGMRNLHSNGASFMMGLIYLHISRSLYSGSHSRSLGVWNSGCFLFIVLMSVAFFGYVLPWGQMSYWGATVIIKLFEAIPVCGGYVLEILWGDYAVSGHTLNRFYSIHFIAPFLMVPLVLIHLHFLHNKGSSNPLGVDSSTNLVPFYPYYALMDGVAVWFWAGLFLLISFGYPFMLGNPLNYEKADGLKTPSHIEPEWYFLPMYAILRSVPHKGLGILAMVFSILILFVIPYSSKSFSMGVSKMWWREIILWMFYLNWFALGWIGSCPMSDPYLALGLAHTVVYFGYFIVDKILIFLLERGVVEKSSTSYHSLPPYLRGFSKTDLAKLNL